MEKVNVWIRKGFGSSDKLIIDIRQTDVVITNGDYRETEELFITGKPIRNEFQMTSQGITYLEDE